MRHLVCALVLALGPAISVRAEAPDAAVLQLAAAAFPEAVRVKHLYSGSDGESHVSEIDLPRVGGTPGRSVQTRLHATDVEMGVSLPGSFVDFHGVTTPRFLIILQGQMEIGLGDGSKHILKKGDIVLAADMTGRGHTSRGVGDEPIISLTVRLPKENALAPKLNPCPPGTDPKDCVAGNVKITVPK
jgi:quercetin dioxygenase-like cupin family protein